MIWQEKYLAKKELVNRLYWDRDDKFYYDIDCKDKHFYKVPTIATYWALTAGIADREQAQALVEKINDPSYFGGEVPLVSLARKDADFCPQGNYWRGALWLPNAYATLKGLSEYGFYQEAQTAAYKIFKHMLATYKEYEPHTIWESYSPDERKPATDASNREIVRPDFCGWSALGPISLYIEYVLGFHTIDAFENVVEWEKPDTFKGKIGIKNLRFGQTVTDIIADENGCYVCTNQAYTLKVNGQSFRIVPGDNKI